MLIGYALLGKTVAYIGVPPLYIGEVVFALGVIAFLSSRCAIASLATLPNLLLALLIGWGIIRTLPYLRENGFDALRDSMLVLYGGFAFIVTALLLEKPERLQLLIKFLRFLALVLVPLAPIIVIMTNAAAHAEGEVTQWSLAHAKIGTTAVHLSAAALLVILGFKRPNLLWCALLIAGMGVAASLNRGAMLVIIFMLTCGSILGGRLREFAVRCRYRSRSSGARLRHRPVDPDRSRNAQHQCRAAGRERRQHFRCARQPGSLRNERVAPALVGYDRRLYHQRPALLDGQGLRRRSRRR